MQQHLFVIILRYIVGLEELDRHTIAHRQFLDEQYQKGFLIASGPQSPRTGGVILARSSKREALETLTHQDPFYQNKCAEYNIYEFEVNKHASEFAKVLENKV